MIGGKVVSLYMPDNKKEIVTIAVEDENGQTLEFRGFSLEGAAMFHVGDFVKITMAVSK